MLNTFITFIDDSWRSSRQKSDFPFILYRSRKVSITRHANDRRFQRVQIRRYYTRYRTSSISIHMALIKDIPQKNDQIEKIRSYAIIFFHDSIPLEMYITCVKQVSYEFDISDTNFLFIHVLFCLYLSFFFIIIFLFCYKENRTTCYKYERM